MKTPKPVEDFYVTEAMINYGGSFVHLLGTAFRHADDVNTEKLKAAFPEYWAQYTEMARKIQS